LIDKWNRDGNDDLNTSAISRGFEKHSESSSNF